MKEYRLGISLNLISHPLDGGVWPITCARFNKCVIPYINRVWKPAGIQFYLQGCREVTGVYGLGTGYLYTPIEAYFSRHALHNHDSHLNIYIVPDLPAGQAGYTVSILDWNGFDGASYIVMGTTSWIGLGTIQPYLKFSNTLAHEIGHALGLGHSDREGSLMWPAVSDNGFDQEELNSDEIKIARRYASFFIPFPFDFIDQLMAALASRSGGRDDISSTIHVDYL